VKKENKEENIKKSSKLGLIIIIAFVVIGIVLFGYLGYRVKKDFFSEKEKTKQLMSLDLYGYTLLDRDGELYRTNFRALETALNEDSINYEEYASLISKLFIIDLFTINNKISSTDIGGLEFVQKDFKDNFAEYIGSSLYKNVETNLDGNREQILPEVSSIEVSEVNKTTYEYSGNEYEAYEVSLTWEYKEDLGYQNNMIVTLII